MNPVHAQNAGVMLHFQCSSGCNTTNDDRTKAYSRTPSAYNSATVTMPNACQVTPTTEHFTPLMTRYRARIEHVAAPLADSTGGAVHTS